MSQSAIRNLQPAIGLNRYATWWVIVVGVLFALPSLDDGLVSDDYGLIEESRIATAQDVWRALTEPGLNGLFRPVPRLLLGLNWAAGRLDPVGYHLINTVLHVGSAVLLYRALVGLVPSPSVSLVAALLFASHFVHVEPVYWVAARTELVATFFVLAAVWGVLQPAGRWSVQTATFACFVAALLSNEMAVTFPLVVAGVRVAQTPGPLVDRLRRGVQSCIPYVAVLVLYGLIRVQVGATLPGTSPVFGFSLHPGLIVRNVEQYALQMVVPVRTILDLRGPGMYGTVTDAVRSRPDETRVFIALIVGAAVLLVVGKKALLLGGRPARLGLAFAGMTALPFLVMEGTGQRYLYLPSAGFVVAVAGVLHGIAGRMNHPQAGGRILSWATGVVVVCSLGLAAEQDRWWERAGRECQTVIRRVAERSVALPPGVPLYVFHLPRRIHGAYVFHNGFDAAMRLSGLTHARRVVDGDRARERGERMPPEAQGYEYGVDR
ncbi:MAG: hypothetical protein HY710_14060 [Candidatus Latescibacteria bacterium]|nr:hypothetical protein [Candidatus Latescibacterota bacterium]